MRLAALEACLSLGVPGLGDRLVPWLSDAERRLRLAAAEGTERESERSGRCPRSPSLERRRRSSAQRCRGGARKSGSAEAELALLGHLDDAAPEVRRVVALALGDLGDPRAVLPLIGKIQDSRPTVREGVAQALAQLGDARAVSALVLSLRDADDSVKVAALGALSRIGDASAVPTFSALLRTGERRGAARGARRVVSAAHARRDEGADRRARHGPPRRRARRRGTSARALGSRRAPSARGLPERRVRSRALGRLRARLGANRAARGRAADQDALRRGALRPLPALLALSDLRAPEALPTVLEYLSDSDLLVRRAARLAAKALLDPQHADGRAVEPLEHALKGSTRDRAALAELLDLLGQTGSPRAARSLLPFAGPSDDVVLRAHALSSARACSVKPDKCPRCSAPWTTIRAACGWRLRLRSAGFRSAGARTSCWIAWSAATSKPGPLLFFALGGALSQEREPQVALRLAQLLAHAQDGERDALIELLGRIPTGEAVARLAALAGASSLAADRAKFAEALAAHPAERSRLLPLLRDSNARRPRQRRLVLG